MLDVELKSAELLDAADTRAAAAYEAHMWREFRTKSAHNAVVSLRDRSSEGVPETSKGVGRMLIIIYSVEVAVPESESLCKMQHSQAKYHYTI